MHAQIWFGVHVPLIDGNKHAQFLFGVHFLPNQTQKNK